MPLVLAECEATESGLTYEDRTGVSYQYPKRYLRMIQPGERFVYYRGRRKRGGGTAPQVYFGTGIVGPAAPDPTREGHYCCRLLDYEAFSGPVYFKDPSGAYYEAGAERRGFFQPGVRRISNDDFRRILEATGQRFAPQSDLAPLPAGAPQGPVYASQENLRAVEEYAIQVALREARRRYPNAKVQPQPRNNPGFDILLRLDESTDPLYVEVKGTSRGRPQFFLTDGELQFSRRQAPRFLLVVVYNVRLPPSERYEIYWHQGYIGPETGFRMNPVQWACELVAADRAHPSSSPASDRGLLATKEDHVIEG